ncbi:MAG: M48 family metallopeptidase [Actinobacteria bacterium]|nr:M48 family metallopeptidase [Actinomycetota bacterium]
MPRRDLPARAHAHDLHLPGLEPDVLPGQVHVPQAVAPAPAPAPPPPPSPSPVIDFKVEVIRSKQRRKSVSAQLIGDTLRLAIPSWMSHDEEAHWVAEMRRRFVRKTSAQRFDLPRRAVALARRYQLSQPDHIRWASDMTTRWGSCTPSTRTIRISDRLAAFPDWVVDYVIVHELAHLDAPGHGDDFWALVRRYPSAERAIGYLIAKSGDAD